jgi:hypothetical protein
MNSLCDNILFLKNKWFSNYIENKDYVLDFLVNPSSARFVYLGKIVYDVLLESAHSTGHFTVVSLLTYTSKSEQEEMFNRAYKLAKLWAFS